MKMASIAILDSEVDIRHPVFKDWNIPQFVFRDGAWIAVEYQPVHGYGTGVASIFLKKRYLCNLKNILAL